MFATGVLPAAGAIAVQSEKSLIGKGWVGSFVTSRQVRFVLSHLWKASVFNPHPYLIFHRQKL